LLICRYLRKTQHISRDPKKVWVPLIKKTALLKVGVWKRKSEICSFKWICLCACMENEKCTQNFNWKTARDYL